MRWSRWRIVGATAGIVVLALVVTGVWYLQPQPLIPEATAALVSTPTVEYSDAEGWLAYRPVGSTPTTGLIFYPGGKVEAAAYAPAAQALAARGYATFVVPMPLNLAVLGVDRALDVMAAHPEIEHWAIGGHSLGGAMAGQFLAGHPGAADGLFLWAAYSSGDVSTQALDAVSIYGSLDSGAASFSSSGNLAKLPPATPTIVIEGGNHEQMGYYTGQANDPSATVPRADQQARAVEATVRLLEAISR